VRKIGGLQIQTSARFGEKKIQILEIYVVSLLTREEGRLSQCGHFRKKEVDQFLQVCADVFYGRLLKVSSDYRSSTSITFKSCFINLFNLRHRRRQWHN